MICLKQSLCTRRGTLFNSENKNSESGYSMQLMKCAECLVFVIFLLSYFSKKRCPEAYRTIEIQFKNRQRIKKIKLRMISFAAG